MSNLQNQNNITNVGFGNVEYSMEEFNFLQQKLDVKLDERSLSRRPGPFGRDVTYIETWRAIELANSTFCFNGWSSSVLEITTDYLEEPIKGKFSCGVAAIVRITVKNGAFHEDVGYGQCENQKSKGIALATAKKNAVSDAIKRALRHFGSQVGLTVYDKQHLKNVNQKIQKQQHQQQEKASSASLTSASAEVINPQAILGQQLQSPQPHQQNWLSSNTTSPTATSISATAIPNITSGNISATISVLSHEQLTSSTGAGGTGTFTNIGNTTTKPGSNSNKENIIQQSIPLPYSHRQNDEKPLIPVIPSVNNIAFPVIIAKNFVGGTGNNNTSNDNSNNGDNNNNNNKTSLVADRILTGMMKSVDEDPIIPVLIRNINK